MTIFRIRTAFVACAFAAMCGAAAQADNEKASKPQPTEKVDGKKSVDANKAVTAPKLRTGEVMTITQTAMTHVAAAEMALEKGNKKAAKTALAKSEKELAKLYNNPALGPVMAQLDQAIDSAGGKNTDINALDLAPLSTTVQTYQAYLDPSVAAGVEQARERAKSGDASGTQEALQLARKRVAMDVSFIPVEDAYIRVIAAQRVLDKGNTKQASRLLRGVPVIVSELQISQPLLPVRFKLHAAAEAAEQNNWDEAEKLLSQVDDELQQLESASTNKQLTGELASLSDKLERMQQDIVAGKNPRPTEIRQLAQQVQGFGADESEMDSNDGKSSSESPSPQRTDGT